MTSNSIPKTIQTDRAYIRATPQARSGTRSRAPSIP
jgi:hypothetical protein